jgi:hypothetical protein
VDDALVEGVVVNKRPRLPRNIRRSPPAQASGPELDSGLARAKAAVEFVDKMHGTLPEQITARDLDVLNAGLRFFFDDLRAASVYAKADGREGAIKALASAWRLVALFKQPLAELLHLPFLHLKDALEMLDKGHVAPMLKPTRRRGRAVSSGPRAALKGRAAAAVEQIMQTGLSHEQAYDLIAKRLARLGVRPERGRGQITATTLRHWCDEVRADVGRHTDAAVVYDSTLTDEECERFSRLPSDDARRSHVLASLTAFIGAHGLAGANPT